MRKTFLLMIFSFPILASAHDMGIKQSKNEDLPFHTMRNVISLPLVIQDASNGDPDPTCSPCIYPIDLGDDQQYCAGRVSHPC
ncbi:hypothetical protein [Brytella acorum]|uniref:hypothetical protein n=1 Tax=Brytella acorum TaxID=2959299 RepID=UPI0025AE4BFD|nr:hypothetical protein [Brytella acorum]MDF3626203.1 hypothetical protein [Brytella acorum]